MVAESEYILLKKFYIGCYHSKSFRHSLVRNINITFLLRVYQKLIEIEYAYIF